MFEASTDKAWHTLGTKNPYYSAVTSSEYLDIADPEKKVAQFVASGEENIRAIFEVIRSSVDNEFRPKRAVDFGCGPGRFVIALATHCKEVIGLDISESMLKEAEKNVRARSLNNVVLAKSDDDVSALNGQYDFIHSYIVFQHVPVGRGERILVSLLSHLSSEGVAVLHFTYARETSALRRFVHVARKHIPFVNGAVNIFQGRQFTHPMMQMNAYDLNRLFRIVQETGFDIAKCQFTNHTGGHLGVILYIRKSEK